MELGKDKSLDDIVDLPLDDLVKSLPRRAARGGVRAEKQPARDGVSADGGKRRGREGGEGRIREGGKGNGPDSPAVSAEQALGTDALGRAPGTRPKAVGRPKRTRKCWRPVEVQPRVSADYRDPHLARGKSGKNKTPKKGGERIKRGWQAAEEHCRESRAISRVSADNRPRPSTTARPHIPAGHWNHAGYGGARDGGHHGRQRSGGRKRDRRGDDRIDHRGFYPDHRGGYPAGRNEHRGGQGWGGNGGGSRGGGGNGGGGYGGGGNDSRRTDVYRPADSSSSAGPTTWQAGRVSADAPIDAPVFPDNEDCVVSMAACE